MDACKNLREAIDEFLVVEIHSKPADERTKRDDLMAAACDALDQLLIVHAARRQGDHSHDERSNRADEGVASVLRAYTEVNREYDLLEVDAELARKMRAGARRNGAK